MINVSSYTSALTAKLITALPTTDIERGERINFDPGRCPWVGVYPGNVSTAPKTIGAGANRWASEMQIQVVAQTSSFVNDGQAASDALEALIASIEQAVDADLTLGLSGFRVLSTSREYRYVVFDDDGGGSIFMPQAVISFNCEARAA